MTQLLQHVPDFNIASAEAIAEERFGIRGRAHSLPSERDQNFLLTDRAGEKFVLKIANALESRAFLEAQNAVLKHLASRVDFCPSLVTDEITSVKAPTGATHFVRAVRYVPGVPLAQICPHSAGLLRPTGRSMQR